MMETLSSHHALPTTSSSLSALSSHISSSSKPMDSNAPRKARPLSHSHLDAFHAPSEVLHQSHYHPSTDQHHFSTSSPADPSNVQHLDVSPRSIPLSFQPLIPQPSNLHNPTLTIRKSTSSTSLPRGSPNSSSSPPHQRALWEMSVSPRTPLPTAVIHPQNENAIADSPPASYPDSPTKPIIFRAPFSEDEFPIPVTEGRRLSCEENTCAHHHHRQSRSSTISISCHSPPPGQLTHLESEVAAEIAMQPMPTEMLVPLIDRGEEMKEMLENPRNETWVRGVRSVLGAEAWEQRCLPLWIGKGRVEMGDREWLRRSRRILVRRGAGGVGDRRLWCEFCAMVGWDIAEEEMLEGEEVEGKGKRRDSEESLQSASSGAMSSIAEVEDEGIRK